MVVGTVSAVPTIIPLPKKAVVVQPTLVQLHERVKDRICAVHTDPIVLSAFVLEEYVILLAQAYPPSATRAGWAGGRRARRTSIRVRDGAGRALGVVAQRMP